MRDVTEIDEKICLLLDRGSLVSCAKANKTWNRIVSPFVWRTIPKDMPTLRWIQFRHIVLEDYLQEIREQEEQDLKEVQPTVKRPRHSVKRPRRSTKKSRRSSQVNTSVKKQPESHKPALLTLDKYRLCVRQVASFVELVKGLEPALLGHDSSRAGYLGPSGMCLAQHLLRRCPEALVTHFQLTHDYVRFDTKYEIVLEILPKVKDLVVKGDPWEGKCFSVAELKRILLTTTENLLSLTIDIPKLKVMDASMANAFILEAGFIVDGVLAATNAEPPEPVIMARPIALKLIALGEANGPGLDWSWLWRACDQVKDIEIHCLLPDVLESIVANIPESMPRLETVVFGAGSRFDAWHHLPLANSIGPILRANANKWMAVHCHPRLEMGPQALDALLEHASTLEDVALDGVLDTTRLVQILASCPKLHNFGNFRDLDNCVDPLPVVDFSGFVDWDPEQNRVRPWLSKSMLETLAITISSIPQQTPWAADNTAMRLCKRLGEFTNLRILQLGSRGSGMEHIRHLKLTLGNGVGALRGLQNLQELHICKLHHAGGLGVKEIRWMVKNWPKLKKICGLGRRSDAYRWLRWNHPRIDLE